MEKRSSWSPDGVNGAPAHLRFCPQAINIFAHESAHIPTSLCSEGLQISSPNTGSPLIDAKPSIEEVLRYADPLIMKFIGDYAADLPYEQKEEAQQTARLRIVQAYKVLDAAAGWKSFVFNHSRGAVLDYLKFGAGFQESKWSISKTEEHGSVHVSKIRERLSLFDSDGESVEIDQILGSNGMFSELDPDAVTIRWELVARMATADPCIHAMARFLLGYAIEDMAPEFDKCRSRVGQFIQAFVDRFDDPQWAESIWFLQTCYAFGLCKAMGLPDVDQSTIPGNPKCGWDYPPKDLASLPEIVEHPLQFSLFEADDNEA